jgi:transcription elongation factor SPT5
VKAEGTKQLSAEVVWDWALDFRNVIVEVGPSRRPGGSAARFQSGQYDGQRFGLTTALPNSQECECQLIQDPSVNLKIPAEFLHPVGPTGSGQRIVILSGQGQGQIRVTQYKDQGQWMMQTTPEHSAMIVVDEDCLCMLWK